MAHKKAAGSSRNGRESASKRLGVKLFGGQIAIPGNIIIRQRGTKFHPGENVGMGKDHTIFSKVEGVVSFTTKKGNRKYVSVLPIEALEEEKPLKVVATKAEPKEVKAPKKAKAEKKESSDDTKAMKAKAPAKAKVEKNEVKAKAAESKKSTKKGDDLKKINGIGPAFEKRLNVMGIFTYKDMSAMTEAKAEKLEEKYNDAMTSPEEWMNWAKEAKELMK